MFDEVLKFCNAVRADLGLDPVGALISGQREVAEFCPISRTINYGADFRVLTSDQVRVYEPGTRSLIDHIYVLPPRIESFVYRFDAGCYPELIA